MGRTAQTGEDADRGTAYRYASNRAQNAEMVPNPDGATQRETAIREHSEAARLADDPAQRRGHLERIAFWRGHYCHELVNYDFGFRYARCLCGWVGPERHYTEALVDMDAHIEEAVCAEARRLGVPCEKD